MQGRAMPSEVEAAKFEELVEDLRLQAFRIYESVRATQRERDASPGERARSLSIAAGLALELVEDVQRITWDVAAVDEGESRARGSVSTAASRANDFVRAVS